MPVLDFRLQHLPQQPFRGLQTGATVAGDFGVR